MTLIVDANVAVKWFVEEERHIHAKNVLNATERMIAPDWIIPEVAHAIFRKFQDRQVTQQQINEALKILPRYFDDLITSASLVDKALNIAIEINHPIYDCIYLASAEQTLGLLITDDKNLIKSTLGTRYKVFVQSLEEFGENHPLQ